MTATHTQLFERQIPTHLKSAGHVIVDTLAAHGVERTYVVPGESFLDVLDGLHNS